MSAVYGGNRSKYKVFIGLMTCQVSGCGGPTSFAHAFDSQAYVSQPMPAQAGYTKTPAYQWASGLVIANYWGVNTSPQAEVASAYQYSLPPTTETMNAYVGSDPGPLWNYIVTTWRNYESRSFRLTEVNGYEGGYSNDQPGAFDSSNTISGITRTNPAVFSLTPEGSFTGSISGATLTATGVSGGVFVNAPLGGSCVSAGTKLSDYVPGSAAAGFGHDGAYKVNNPQMASCAMTTSGVGAVVGTTVTVSGVAGMTQINNPAPEAVTFSNGSAVISGANTLRQGQAVVFATNGMLPTNFLVETSYCVLSTGLSSSVFQVTTTANCGGTGSAVVARSAGRGSHTAQEAWFVSAVNAANNTASLGVDSTGFGIYTSGAVFAYYGSRNYVGALRARSYQSIIVGTYAASIFSAHNAAGAAFPSMYNLAGSTRGDSWAVWLPDIYGATNSALDPGTPQWQAIKKCNSRVPCSYP